MVMRSALLSVIVVLFASACSAASGEVTATDSSKLVGKWTYREGSAIVLDCPNAPTQLIDLSKVPPSNEPVSFTLSPKSADTVHEIDALGCEFDWIVAGDSASPSPTDSCASFPDGRGGNVAVHVLSGTKSTTDGASMNVLVHLATDITGCEVTVLGRAKKS